jgi:DNA-binding FadR family transcriptional regulator
MNNNDSRPLIERTADRLVQYIIDRDLNDGDKLPNMRELGVRLGVGRGTLREALRILTSRNVLEVRHGAGVFISQKNGVSDDPLGFTFIKDKGKLIQDLLEFRMVLEPRIAAQAAQYADSEDIAELERLCDAVDEQILRKIPHMQKDAEFHTKIAQCSRNLIMPKLMPIIHSSISLVITETGGVLDIETMKTHRAVLSAIKRKDGVAASDAMLMHLIYNRDCLREICNSWR